VGAVTDGDSSSPLVNGARGGCFGSARARSRPGEQGATLVEFAILLPVIVLVVFGIIDFGSLYNDYQSLRQGARDGIRTAIVQNALGAGPTCLPQGGNVPILPVTNTARNFVCYTKSKVGLTTKNVRVKIVWKGPPSGSGATADNSAFPTGNPVMFCVQYPKSSLTGFLKAFIKNGALNTQTETLIEQDQTDSSLTGTTPSFTIQEAPNPGTSWPSSCLTGNL